MRVTSVLYASAGNLHRGPRPDRAGTSSAGQSDRHSRARDSGACGSRRSDPRGRVGLFDAVVKYDESKNVAFHSYAKHRIKGAILDSLRQLDWASRDLRKRQKQVDSTTRDLCAKLGRTPTEGEVAQEMGLSMERWRRMLMELQRRIGFGLVASRQERDRTQEFAAKPDFQPDHMCQRRQLQVTLARAIETLPAGTRRWCASTTRKNGP